MPYELENRLVIGVAVRAEGKDEFGFSLAGVTSGEGWRVNRKLLVCVETGQAVAFLIVASAADHSLMDKRVQDIEDWMASKI